MASLHCGDGKMVSHCVMRIDSPTKCKMAIEYIISPSVLNVVVLNTAYQAYYQLSPITFSYLADALIQSDLQ